MAETVILAEQTLDGFAYNSGTQTYLKSVSGIVLEPDTKYRVVWGPDEFVLTTYSFQNSGYEAIGLGNEGLATGTSAEMVEPFMMYYIIENNFFAIATFSPEASHTVGIYLVDEESGGSSGVDIVLKDRNGNPVEYPGVERVKLNTVGGGTAEFIAESAIPTAVTKEVTQEELNFSGGAVTLTPDRGKVFGGVTIPVPDNLAAENIAEGVDIAGIIGTLAASGGGAKIASGEISTSGGPITVEHGLGVVPDMVIVWTGGAVKSSIVCALAINRTLTSNLGLIACNVVWARNSSNADVGMFVASGLGATAGPYIHNVTESTFDIGNTTYPISTLLFSPSWIAIGGLT